MTYQKEKFFKNPIYSHIKIIKYLGINKQGGDDLSSENSKTLMKEMIQ